MLVPLILATSVAHAGGCDAKALTRAVDEATPGGVVQAYTDLAKCDKTAAKAQTPAAFQKVIPGPAAFPAVLTALQLGQGQAIRTWVGTMQPDERGNFMNLLGQKCDAAEVPAFFVDTARNDPDHFWNDRYYAGLDECRVPAAVNLLEGLLATPDDDRGRYQSTLEVYGRNLGAKAIPKFTEWLQAPKDSVQATFLLGAYPDAAGVGSAEGTNAAAAEQAIAAILGLAPKLPDRSIEAARNALRALGDDANSDKIVVQRWRDRVQPAGGLLYGVFVVNAASCKKDTRVETHSGQVVDSGHTWPDQLDERLKDHVAKVEWHLPKDCKGTPEVILPIEPFRDMVAYQAWVKQTEKEVAKKYPQVTPKAYNEPPVNL